VQLRCQHAQLIVIDEISMLHPRHFELLDELLKLCKGCREPMGGVQIICTGDFCQLPPVLTSMNGITQFCKATNTNTSITSSSNTSNSSNVNTSSSSKQLKYCFQSVVWKDLFKIENCSLLSEIFRQKDDPNFAQLLEDLRYGELHMEILPNIQCII
jgi:ATP-dependent DNA helicase PIF1